MSDLKESVRVFTAALNRKADAVDDQLELREAIEDKDSDKLKKLLNRGSGSVATKNLLTQMKTRSYKVVDILKLL